MPSLGSYDSFDEFDRAIRYRTHIADIGQSTPRMLSVEDTADHVLFTKMCWLVEEAGPGIMAKVTAVLPVITRTAKPRLDFLAVPLYGPFVTSSVGDKFAQSVALAAEGKPLHLYLQAGGELPFWNVATVEEEHAVTDIRDNWFRPLFTSQHWMPTTDFVAEWYDAVVIGSEESTLEEFAG